MDCAWMQVYKRGAPPGGGGEVQLSVPVARSLPPISLTEEGAVRTLSKLVRTTEITALCATLHTLVSGPRSKHGFLSWFQH